MTTFDLVDIYLFNCVSTKYKNSGSSSKCCSMVEEMNDVRDLYLKNANIEDVLRKCVCDRHGHQYCISGDAVDKAIYNLKEGECTIGSMMTKPFVNKNNEFLQFNDFEELYHFVKSTIGSISGIGPLTVYDTAKRIGHILKNPVYPSQYVYLCAGAADGAKGLIGKDSPLLFREPTYRFTPFFGTLPSIFIEDILCIFKDELKNGTEGLKHISNSTVIDKSTNCSFCNNVVVNSI